jgi:uncharacterized membrane protein
MVHTANDQELTMDFETSVDINAPSDAVWVTLIDVERWPDFTPSITSLELLHASPLTVGSRARIKQPGTPPLVWEVTSFEPGTSFTWRAKSLGITSVGSHKLRPVVGGVQVTFGLHQTGPLAPIVQLFTGARTRRYVETEAASLKKRCEGAAQSASPFSRTVR